MADIVPQEMSGANPKDPVQQATLTTDDELATDCLLIPHEIRSSRRASFRHISSAGSTHSAGNSAGEAAQHGLGQAHPLLVARFIRHAAVAVREEQLHHLERGTAEP